jgi:hypothetical protein
MTLTSTASSRGDMQDKLRTALLSYGEREVNLSIDDLIGKTGLSYSQIYQALYRLQRLGELEILREQEPNGKARVAGVRLARMETPDTITQRTVERSIARQTTKDFTNVSLNVPNIIEYMNQKLAIERARAEIVKANINPDDVISFAPNPLGEEGLFLLSKLQEVVEQARMLSNDLEAEKRNAQYYKEKIAVTTFDDSGT